MLSQQNDLSLIAVPLRLVATCKLLMRYNSRPPQSAASGLPAATGYLRYVVHNQLAEVVREILPDFENVVCEVSTITEEADNRTIHFLTK
ncbi:hypothetical protein LguiB_008497 [Lonicera macranthoides]